MTCLSSLTYMEIDMFPATSLWFSAKLKLNLRLLQTERNVEHKINAWKEIVGYMHNCTCIIFFSESVC